MAPARDRVPVHRMDLQRAGYPFVGDCSPRRRSDESTFRSRTPGCDYLSRMHPHPADLVDMVFDEATHTYTYYGKKVEKSCTALVAENFKAFDASAVVDLNFERWKCYQDPRYWDIIGLTLSDNGNDRIGDLEAKARILHLWESVGAEASRKGTLLHTYCERVFNLAPGHSPLSHVGYEDIVQEVNQFEAFLCSDFVKRHSLEPFATELLVWYTRNNDIVSAGQVDALMRSTATGDLFLIDWKRVACKHDLLSDVGPYEDRFGFGVCWAVPDNKFHKYSLQCSIYALMLQHSHGYDVGRRCFLVRMHSDRANYQIVRCHDWRSVAQSLLEGEHKRLREGQFQGLDPEVSSMS